MSDQSLQPDTPAERLVPRYTWDDIVLPDDVVRDLRAAAAQVRHQARVYGDYGFARRYPRGRGISLLLAGPSGTGKAMAAEVIAGDLGLDLLRIDLARVVSKYIGETEKNLAAVFAAAEATGAVLLFDEADALFGLRSDVKDSHDRYANIEASYLLQRLETYDGLAILAVSTRSHLDPALLRGLRYVVDVPFPDAAARRLIWQKAIPAEMPCASLDFDALSRLDIAGGNIAVIVLNAAFLAAQDGRPLDMRHLAQATRAEYRKLNRELATLPG
jgi:SpoVK/Ycf46/Vps4 family AAA+-type ATPase